MPLKTLLLPFLLIIFIAADVFSQGNFLGFDQQQCNLVPNPGYTWTRRMGPCSSHSTTYKIFFKDELVYEKPCEYLSSYGVDTLLLVNDSTGFLIESSNYGYGVYKTSDYGKSWKRLGAGAPGLWGYFVVNEHYLYLFTSPDNRNPVISRASDINGKGNYAYYQETNIINKQAVFNDTIYGDIFCDIDTLSFKVKDYADTIRYIFAFHNEPLLTGNNSIPLQQFEIYPNPCADYINFPQYMTSSGSRCSIYTLQGSIVKSCPLHTTRLFIGDLRQGVYLVEVVSGDKKVIRKMVKQ